MYGSNPGPDSLEQAACPDSRVQTQASEIQHLELLPGAGRVARGRTKTGPQGQR